MSRVPIMAGNWKMTLGPAVKCELAPLTFYLGAGVSGGVLIHKAKASEDADPPESIRFWSLGVGGDTGLKYRIGQDLFLLAGVQAHYALQIFISDKNLADNFYDWQIFSFTPYLGVGLQF